MYTWEQSLGNLINWFNPNSYKSNVKLKNRFWLWRVFTPWAEQPIDAYKKGYIIKDNINVTNYLNNFTTILPKNPIFYFDYTSKFPRAKLKVCNYKRVIKEDKANITVVKEKNEIISIPDIYHVFTDCVELFCIKDTDFQQFFNGEWQQLQTSQHLGIKWKATLDLIYSGKIKIVYGSGIVYKNLTMPYITDCDLDKILSRNLPTPTLDELQSIAEMLNSSDSNIIKLGSLMAAGFNITDYLLTFRVLMGLNVAWTAAYNGGRTSVPWQLQRSLGMETSSCGGWHCLSAFIQAKSDKYSSEDICLAQELTKNLPGIENFCKKTENFYLDSLPFIPDEYKN